jgi:hypothetical protein
MEKDPRLKVGIRELHSCHCYMFGFSLKRVIMYRVRGLAG